MADIDVQKKKPSVWPWIIGIIAILVIIWIVYEAMDDDDDTDNDNNTEEVIDHNDESGFLKTPDKTAMIEIGTIYFSESTYA